MQSKTQCLAAMLTKYVSSLRPSRRFRDRGRSGKAGPNIEAIQKGLKIMMYVPCVNDESMLLFPSGECEASKRVYECSLNIYINFEIKVTQTFSIMH